MGTVEAGHTGVGMCFVVQVVDTFFLLDVPDGNVAVDGTSDEKGGKRWGPSNARDVFSVGGNELGQGAGVQGIDVDGGGGGVGEGVGACRGGVWVWGGGFVGQEMIHARISSTVGRVTHLCPQRGVY